MVDDLEERLGRYRADLDTAVAADLARRQLASREAESHVADPLLLLDTDHLMRLEPTVSAPSVGRRGTLVATLGVIAAVTTLVLVALVVSGDDAATPADQPSPTVPPSTQSSASLAVELEPGTYDIDPWLQMPTGISVTVGAGWSYDTWNPNGLIIGNQSGAIGFGRPGAVFSDACHPSEGYLPGPVATLDGFVARLSEQEGWVDVTGPTDIAVNGYAGKAFQRTAPIDMADCDTAVYGHRLESGRATLGPVFRSWDAPIAGMYEPGRTETLWVLDIDGTVVVINASPWPEASAAGRAEIATALDSIRIDRP